MPIILSCLALGVSAAVGWFLASLAYNLDKKPGTTVNTLGLILFLLFSAVAFAISFVATCSLFILLFSQSLLDIPVYIVFALGCLASAMAIIVKHLREQRKKRLMQSQKINVDGIKVPVPAPADEPSWRTHDSRRF